MADAYNLQRFVEAQGPVYESVLEELKAGYKYGHWMWYIFPQIQGLGRSGMSKWYAISSRDEAKAYLEHLILGPRLRHCAQLIVDLEDRTVEQIFGYPDDLKFRSCMTLFAEVASDPGVFQAALRKYFDGKPDPLTLDILKETNAGSRSSPI